MGNLASRTRRVPFIQWMCQSQDREDKTNRLSCVFGRVCNCPSMPTEVNSLDASEDTVYNDRHVSPASSSNANPVPPNDRHQLAFGLSSPRCHSTSPSDCGSPLSARARRS